jgi:DNA sulfur modification protein DndB
MPKTRLPKAGHQTSSELAEANALEFAALRGVQAGAEYFVVMVPLRLVPQLFRFDEADLPAELRAQRILNKTRVPAIARYIVEHPKEYVLSALCASVDGALDFTPLEPKGPLRSVGRLRVGMTGTLLINDGQHRRAAIEAALCERPTLGNESIAIVIFVDLGLVRAQQMFADLNLHAVRPSRSIGVLYDHRDPLATLVRAVMQAIPLFRDFVELEKTSISNRSQKLFTLSSLFQATRELLGPIEDVSRENMERLQERAVEFWSAVIAQMPDWQAVAKRGVAAAELRRDYVHAHGVALQALGIVGGQLFASRPKNWTKPLRHLSELDWSRRNVGQWEGRVLLAGRVQKSQQAVNALAATLFGLMDVPPTPEVEQFVSTASPKRQTTSANATSPAHS